jgi:hypothetical protein
MGILPKADASFSSIGFASSVSDVSCEQLAISSSRYSSIRANLLSDPEARFEPKMNYAEAFLRDQISMTQRSLIPVTLKAAYAAATALSRAMT